MNKKLLFLMVGVFCISLLVRTGFMFLNPKSELKGDEPEYYQSAIRLLQGEGLHFGEGMRSYRGPLYPAFLALVFSLYPHSVTAVIFGQALLSSLTIVFIALIAFYFRGPAIAVISGVFASVYYGLFVRVTHLYPDILFGFFLTFSVIFLLRLKKEPFLRNKIIVGCSLGIAALVKPVPILFLLFIFLWLWFDHKRLLDTVKIFLPIVVCFMLVLTPYMIRNFRIHGRIVLVSTEGGITFWGSNNLLAKGSWDVAGTTWLSPRFTSMPEVERDRAYYKEGFKFLISQNPVSLAKLFLLKIANTFYPFMPEYDWTFVFLMPLALIGMFYTFSRIDKNCLLFYPMVLFLLLTLVFCGYPRFREPMAPFLVIFSSLTAERIWRNARKRSLLGLWLIVNLLVWLYSEPIRQSLKTVIGY